MGGDSGASDAGGFGESEKAGVVTGVGMSSGENSSGGDGARDGVDRGGASVGSRGVRCGSGSGDSDGGHGKILLRWLVLLAWFVSLVA